MLRTIIFKVALYTYFILWSPILLIGLISKRLIRFLIRVCAMGVLGLSHYIAGIKYEIHYPPVEENGIPVVRNGNIRFDGKSIIAAKHMSILEVAILTVHVPNFFFIIKRELLWIPVYGWAFWRMGLQPVNRARGATNMKKLTHAVAKKIMDGQNLIIFPEGTRTKPGHPYCPLVLIQVNIGQSMVKCILARPTCGLNQCYHATHHWMKLGRQSIATAHNKNIKILQPMQDFYLHHDIRLPPLYDRPSPSSVIIRDKLRPSGNMTPASIRPKYLSSVISTSSTTVPTGINSTNLSRARFAITFSDSHIPFISGVSISATRTRTFIFMPSSNNRRAAKVSPSIT